MKTRFPGNLGRVFVQFSILTILAACSNSEKYIVGEGGGPYNMVLFVESRSWRSGQSLEMVFRLTDSRTGESVKNLQLAHQRLMHIFVTNQTLDYFSHLHVEKNLENEIGADGYFSVQHAFNKSGIYRIVVEFVHRNKIWNKSFDVVVGESEDRSKVPIIDSLKNPTYVAELKRGKKIISGKEVELAIEINRDGRPIRDLQLFLGSELHGAVWREDLENFGHLHSFTPKMENLIREIRTRKNGMRVSPAELQEVLVEVMCSDSELVFSGPLVPIRYTFPDPGIYHLFAQVAPAGVPQTFKFVLNVESVVY